MDFVDDQLLNMLTKIYAAFSQDFKEFQSDDTVLSLDRYANVGKQLMLIEQEWRRHQPAVTLGRGHPETGSQRMAVAGGAARPG